MSPGSACRILIVEDDADSSEPLAAFLRRRGHHVRCAATVESAEALMTDDITHLILDLRLPDGTGLRLLERAREELAVKVAVVTGLGGDALAADAVLMHPDVFLTKPVDFGDMLAWLEGRPTLNDYLASAGGAVGVSGWEAGGAGRSAAV